MHDFKMSLWMLPDSKMATQLLTLPQPHPVSHLPHSVGPIFALIQLGPKMFILFQLKTLPPWWPICHIKRGSPLQICLTTFRAPRQEGSAFPQQKTTKIINLIHVIWQGHNEQGICCGSLDCQWTSQCMRHDSFAQPEDVDDLTVIHKTLDTLCHCPGSCAIQMCILDQLKVFCLPCLDQPLPFLL